jgi:uncharacterized membrane protein
MRYTGVSHLGRILASRRNLPDLIAPATSIQRWEVDGMTLGILVFVLVLTMSAVALVLIRVPTTPAREPARAVSPFDEAERILSSRYARGQITPEEYERMLTVLRR